MKKMELFALEFDEILFYNETIYYMEMPESWRDFFKRERTENNYKLEYKVEPLGKKLRSIFPEIVSVYLDYKVLLNNKPWLVSTKPIPVSYIKQLTLGWLAHLKGYTISELPLGVRDMDPIWVTSTFSDIHESIDKFQWAPGIAAIKFCQDRRMLEFSNEISEAIKFNHVIFNGIHECVSEPIQKSPRHDPFSYVIRLQLKTRGCDAGRFILTVSLGTRRYLSKAQINDGKCFMRAGHACSVLVSVQNPYEMNGDKSFSQLKFERRPGRRSSFTAWETALDGLYWDVLNGEAFESDFLLVNPKVYSEGNGEVTAYIVNNNLFHANSVKAGIGLSEKSGLFNVFKSFLQDSSVQQLPHISDISRRGMNDSRFPIVATKEETITLEIYGTIQLFEAIKKVLTTEQKSIENIIILNDKSSENYYKLNCNREVKIQLTHRSSDGIVAELEVDKYKENSSAHKKLVNQIAKQLSVDEQHHKSVIAIVEIEEKDKWREGGDPKKAIREGMKKTGRLTQFIHPLSDNETADVSRIINSTLDLFNDYGLLSNNVNKIIVPGTLLSVTVLKSGNKYLPAMSRLFKTELSIKVLGIDSWMSLYEAALNIDNAKFLDNPRKDNRSREVFEAFVTREIENEIDQGAEQVTVLVNAVLRNNWMRSIGNTKIQGNQVPVLNERLSNESRLKFVRVNATDDVPQYRIIIDEVVNQFNKASGIFKDPIGIYYGVGGRPSAWKGISNEATKFSSPSKQLLQQRAVEYIPLGAMDEDERDNLAILVDHLRRLGVTYDKHTVFPYTMRVLSSLLKYVTGNEDDYDYDAEFDEEVQVDLEGEMTIESSI